MRFSSVFSKYNRGVYLLIANSFHPENLGWIFYILQDLNEINSSEII